MVCLLDFLQVQHFRVVGTINYDYSSTYRVIVGQKIYLIRIARLNLKNSKYLGVETNFIDGWMDDYLNFGTVS